MSLTQKIVEICQENEDYAIEVISCKSWAAWREENREEYLQILADYNGREKPEILPDTEINLQPIKDRFMEYLDQVALGEDSSQLRTRIFNAAIEALYGEDVWNWINSKLP